MSHTALSDLLPPKAIDDAAEVLPSHPFEVQRLRRHFRNAVMLTVKGRRAGQISRALVEWIYDHQEILGLEDVFIVSEQDELDCLDSGAAREAIRRVLPRLREERPQSASPLEKRLRWTADTLGLNATDAEILGLAVRAALFTPFHKLACAAEDSCRSDAEINVEAIARLIGRPERMIRDRLHRGQPLLQLGLLEDRKGGDYAPSRTVLNIARIRTCDPKRLRATLLGKAPRAALTWSDFDHLGEARNLAHDLLSAALDGQEPGIGILLYGAPGGGKTEFARVLANRLGAHAVFVGEAGNEDGEPSREDRIAHLALASVLATGAGRTVLVVDEADDLFTGVDEDDHASRTGSKVFMNRLVERCPAPTVWITNSPGRLGRAVVRRMSLAIPFREPGRAVRRRIAERLARKRKLSLTAADLDALSGIPAAPALIDAGLRTAALTDCLAASATTCTHSLLTAMGMNAAPAMPAGPVAFDPSLSAADCDLEMLAERVVAAPDMALSFCLYGLPGTGKSAYARYLAERLEMEVIEKRASDLLSMWLGGTEKAIAEMFTEAVDARAMLVLDEADSLLRDRAGARHSWEVTQVNEMLTWMERHPYPFVCTTNLMDSLDPATLRRFLFKVQFLPMRPAQAAEDFRRSFGAEPPPALSRLDLLTPGDFAVVARKARLLGERDPQGLLTMLQAEVAAKPGAARERIGF